MNRQSRRTRWLAGALGVLLALAVVPAAALAAPEGDQGDTLDEQTTVTTDDAAEGGVADGEDNGETNVEPRAAADNSLDVVYVSSSGNDETGAGTQDSPVASLSKAVNVAKDGATIYVMDGLTMTKSARFYNKDLTITSGDGGPYTVTRDDTFDSLSDNARSRYNPAMIEVGGTAGVNSASLTLSNIVFDDAGKSAGEYFIQAASNGTGSTHFGDLDINHLSIVQDAIIATYNGVGTITLGDGAVLKNYGGMSAVRLSDGELIMKSGSMICDDTVTDRTKGATITGTQAYLYGPAGAIWMQGGSVTMEQGSRIDDIVGRAIYNEAGSADIDGEITGVVADSHMWQGTSGVVMHMRVDATAHFGQHAVIDGEGKTLQGSGIAVIGGCELTLDEGSLIKGYSAGSVLDIGGTAYLNGEITGNTGNGHVIVAQSSSNHYIRIGETANIHHNVCSYGVIYTQGSNGVIDIYGKMNDNISNDRGGALVLANNGTHVEANMYEGAEMLNNVSTQTGGAVMVSCGTFTMYGGTISGNISGAGNVGAGDKAAGGVYVRRGGQFIMNGGTISDNTAAGIGGNIAVVTEDYNNSVGYVQLNGGTISGGTMNATVTADGNGSYVAEGGDSNDIAIVGGSSYGTTDRYVSISDNVALGNQSIFMDDYDFTIENPGDDVKIANASAACENAVTSQFASQYLDVVVGSFWYESDNPLQQFTISEPTNDVYDAAESTFVAYVPTDESGSPVSGSSATLVATEVVDGKIQLTLPNSNEAGYAVLLLQENDESSGIVTVTPADVTVYMGGDGGYDAVVEDGQTVESNSLPRPMFKIAAPEGLDVERLVFTNTESGNSWTPVSLGGGYYRFEPSATTDVGVRVQYTNSQGVAVSEDTFQPIVEGEVFKEYVISVYGGGTSGTAGVTYEGDNYTAVTGVGTLTVRAIENSDSTAVTSDVSASAPTAPLESGTAVAVAPEGTVFTLNDTGVTLPDEAKPSLLFDDIIGSDGVDRETPLKAAVDAELGASATARNYELKYLDLVDANNGNAWITAEGGVDVYWAYPEGTDQSTDFSLLHFAGLHRDGSQSGFDVEDIASAAVSSVSITKTENGILFHVGKGGFSPFVLAWDDEYTITFDANGGSVTPQTAVTEAGKISFLPTPLREGYLFDGWFTAAEDGDVVTTSTVFTADATVYAHWTEVSEPPAHEHVWSDWKCDGESHWKVCEVCGAISDRGAHKYGEWSQVSGATATQKGQWVRVCSVCGYEQYGTTSEATADDSGMPGTGDSSPALLPVVLLGVGAVAVGSAIFYRGRNNG